MGGNTDPKTLRVLANVLSLVLSDQEGEAVNAFLLVRKKAAEDSVTAGSIKNAFDNACLQTAQAEKDQPTTFQIQELTSQVNKLTLKVQKLTKQLKTAKNRQKETASNQEEVLWHSQIIMKYLDELLDLSGYEQTEPEWEVSPIIRNNLPGLARRFLSFLASIIFSLHIAPRFLVEAHNERVYLRRAIQLAAAYDKVTVSLIEREWPASKEFSFYIIEKMESLGLIQRVEAVSTASEEFVELEHADGFNQPAKVRSRMIDFVQQLVAAKPGRE
jgi:hypothetical protein